MLNRKRLLITGVVNTNSIAYATAERALEEGAEVLLTAFPRDMELTELAAEQLPRKVGIAGCDATRKEDLDGLRARIEADFGQLDGILHAIAFAPREALAGDFFEARPDSVSLAFHTSAYSFASLGQLLRDLAPAEGGSIVGLDFDAAGAWPVYNWMGVCKAGLESVNRYLARDLGPMGIRSNLIAAGPLNTRAAGGIPDFEALLEAWEGRSPMRWDPDDPYPVADVACFLFSEMSRSMSGEILHADGGYHAMAGNLRKVGVGEPAGGSA